MAKTDPDAQAQTPEGAAPQTDAQAAPASALETLALAGDEAARRALGQPTAGASDPKVTAAAASKGFRIGEPAPRDVYVDQDGKLADPSKVEKGEPFRGTRVALKGSTVTASTVVALQAAGEL